MLINVLLGILKFIGIVLLFDLIILNILASARYDAKTLSSELKNGFNWRTVLGFILFSIAFVIFGVEKLVSKIVEIRYQDFERAKKIF